MTPEQVGHHFAIPGWQTALEQDVLPGCLLGQRWFAGKNRQWARLRVLDWCVLGPGHDEHTPVLLIAEPVYDRGPSEAYAIPVWLGGAPAVKLDAALLVVAAEFFIKLMHDQSTAATKCGALQGHHTHGFPPPEPGVTVEPPQSLEQSNTSMRIGERWMLKLVRRLEPGPNPDVEIGHFLLEQTKFRRTPALSGWVEYLREGQLATSIAILQQFVRSECSGWDLALMSAGREAALTLVSDKLDAKVSEHVPDTGLSAELLGWRTAEMHLALASRGDDPEFLPEALTTADVAALGERVRLHIAEATPRLTELARTDDVAGRAAARLLQVRERVLEKTSTSILASLGAKTRVHGDYHLGQVLWTGKDYWVLDFEGEPTRPLAERRLKHSPLKDVAGMLRSFDYAAQTVLRELSVSPLAKADMEAGAKRWQKEATADFLRGYHATTGAATCLPVNEASFEALLNLYLLDKAAYEMHYELNNRPDWVSIPLLGILNLAQ